MTPDGGGTARRVAGPPAAAAPGATATERIGPSPPGSAPLPAPADRSAANRPWISWAAPRVRRAATLDSRSLLVVILIVAGLVRLGGALAGTPCVITDRAEAAAAAAAAGKCVSYNDSVTYLTDARLNAEGEWFHTREGDDPPVDTALHAPAFSVILTPFIWAGVDTYDGLRIAVALLGTVGVAVIHLLGRRIGGPGVGLVAAAIAALHPLIWINDVVLMPEGLFAAAVAGIAVLAYRFHDEPTLARAAALGAGIAGAGLLRNEALLAVGFVVVPLILGLRSLPLASRALRGAAVVGMVLLVVSPWVAFNWARFDRPLLTNGVGAGLRVGTCDETFYNDTLLGLRSVDCLEQDGVELRLPENDTEIDRSRVFQDGAVEHYRENLGRTPTVVAARIGRFWGLWRPLESVRLDDAIEQRGAQRAQVGVLVGWLLVPLAAYGAVVLWRRRVPLSPLLGWVASSTLLAAANQPLQRFRVGGEVAVLVLAAVGAVAVSRFPWVRPLVEAEPLTEADDQLPMPSPPSTGTTAPVT